LVLTKPAPRRTVFGLLVVTAFVGVVRAGVATRAGLGADRRSLRVLGFSRAAARSGAGATGSRFTGALTAGAAGVGLATAALGTGTAAGAGTAGAGASTAAGAGASTASASTVGVWLEVRLYGAFTCPSSLLLRMSTKPIVPTIKNAATATHHIRIGLVGIPAADSPKSSSS